MHTILPHCDELKERDSGRVEERWMGHTETSVMILDALEDLKISCGTEHKPQNQPCQHACFYQIIHRKWRYTYSRWHKPMVHAMSLSKSATVLHEIQSVDDGPCKRGNKKSHLVCMLVVRCLRRRTTSVAVSVRSFAVLAL
jgi:hypothetical protein